MTERKVSTPQVGESLLSIATNYRDRAGYSVIPIKGDGTKAPALQWSEYEKRKATDEELTAWFGPQSRYGIGLVQGIVSGNAEVLDIETGAVDEFLSNCEKGGFSDLVARCPRVLTPKGGLHLYYRMESAPEGNQKLSRWKDSSTKIETRGEGGQVLAVGSPGRCHPSGKPYQQQEGAPGFESAPTLTAAERDALFAMARATNEFEPKKIYTPKTDGSPKSDVPEGGRPGDVFNREVTQSQVRELLERAGWQLSHERGGVDFMTRPGKNPREGISGTIGALDDANVFYCFSSNAYPFEEGTAYPPFAVYAMLLHNGDFPAAAKDLAAQGYGESLRPAAKRQGGKPAGAASDLSDYIPGTPATDEQDAESKKIAAALRLVEIAQERAELWHSEDDTAYATLAGKRESVRVASTRFRDHLRGWFFEETGKVVAPSAMQAAIDQLEGFARLGGRCYPVYSRKAHVGDTIYIDLCDEEYRAVKVTCAGWEVVTDYPVRFRRSKSMRALPVPVQGGSIEELRPFLNTPKDTDGADRLFPLAVAWALAALGPHQPYPILNLTGEQGSAKTGTARILRSLIDPADPDLRREPKDERDLAIAANNSHVVAWDNLSGLPGWLSDAFCCLSTGGGFGTRKNYTDDEEALFSNKAPVLLTGIGEASVRGDFLERSIILSLPTIGETGRKTEREIKEAFEVARPRILGALLSIVAVGLRNLPTTRLEKLPRMADFALWVTACEESCPWPRGNFQTVYSGNQDSAAASALDADFIADLVQRFLSNSGGEWSGTATELLEGIAKLATFEQSRMLPRNAQVMSSRLHRLAPALRKGGIETTNRRTKRGSEWTIGSGGLYGDALSVKGDALPGKRPTPIEAPPTSHEDRQGVDGEALTQQFPSSSISVETRVKGGKEREIGIGIREEYKDSPEATPASLSTPDPESRRRRALDAVRSRSMPGDVSDPVILPDGSSTTNPSGAFQRAWNECSCLKKAHPETWRETPDGQKQIAVLDSIAGWWETYEDPFCFGGGSAIA